MGPVELRRHFHIGAFMQIPGCRKNRRIEGDLIALIVVRNNKLICAQVEEGDTASERDFGARCGEDRNAVGNSLPCCPMRMSP